MRSLRQKAGRDTGERIGELANWTRETAEREVGGRRRKWRRHWGKKREMEIKGIGGSLGTNVKLNNGDNFFFFFNGRKFEYNNF